MYCFYAGHDASNNTEKPGTATYRRGYSSIRCSCCHLIVCQEHIHVCSGGSLHHQRYLLVHARTSIDQHSLRRFGQPHITYTTPASAHDVGNSCSPSPDSTVGNFCKSPGPPPRTLPRVTSALPRHLPPSPLVDLRSPSLTDLSRVAGDLNETTAKSLRTTSDDPARLSPYTQLVDHRL